MRIAFVGLLLLLTGVARINATTYFVDYLGGLDSNAGTSPSSPWKHCPGDPAATEVVSAVPLFAGDSVQFKGGVTYVLSGATGIVLNWDGAQGSVITYDGNSAGTWGSGRAIFTDNHGGRAITGFFSSSYRRHLIFKSLEFSGIGGSAALPIDLGVPSAPRFGGGLHFGGGAENVTIDGCVFRELGYWFNQKPMTAAALVGTGISIAGAQGLVISNCDFSRVPIGCDFSSATQVSNVQITRCTFADSILWPINLPASTPGGAAQIDTRDSYFPSVSTLGGSYWIGYGYDPRSEVVSANTGNAVTFAATALASPAASFQWRKNGIPIAGATSATLHLPSVSAIDAATYTAMATNVAGSATSNTAMLIVDGITPGTTTSDPLNPSGPTFVVPTFVFQPSSQSAIAQSTVTFTGAASGSPVPTYQWLKNGYPVAGATGTTLTLPNVSNNDVGTYQVVATNSVGSVTSSTAQLTLSFVSTMVAPVITTHPVTQVVAARGTVSFIGAATGTPTPTYQWLKDSIPIAGATSAMLTFGVVTATDAGKYSFMATNSVGSTVSNDAYLAVSDAPTFTVQPVDRIAAPSTTVVFTASASGTPAPTYQWVKNGNLLSGATNANLTLQSVTTNDVGSYQVIASNSVGSALSSAAQLTVTVDPTIVAPVIATHPVSQTVMTFASVTFTAAATGVPAPTYQWLKNGAPLADATSASLTLQAVTANDSARYSVVAKNLGGSAVSNEATLGVSEIISTNNNVSTVPFDAISVINRIDAAGVPVAVNFVIPGTTAKKILLRAVGPSLVSFASGALSDPLLDLYQGEIRTFRNDNWEGDSALTDAFNRTGAFPLVNPTSKDAALLVTLAPGSYTAVVSGVNGATGAVLIEIYEVP